MSKQTEIEEQKENLQGMDRGRLNQRSIEIAEIYLKRYPNTWKEEIKKKQRIRSN